MTMIKAVTMTMIGAVMMMTMMITAAKMKLISVSV
jgi:hypothetical protein